MTQSRTPTIYMLPEISIFLRSHANDLRASQTCKNIDFLEWHTRFTTIAGQCKSTECLVVFALSGMYMTRMYTLDYNCDFDVTRKEVFDCFNIELLNKFDKSKGFLGKCQEDK